MIPAHVVPNGVNGLTGEYLHSPVSIADIAQVAREEGVWRPVRTRGLPPGVDPCDLEETGWGVVFPEGTPRSIREALRVLLQHRREQAGVRYRELHYRTGETKEQFLSRYSSAPGPADPEALPYYLLLVGGPEAIPFSFQYQLDVQYAVGRVSFKASKEYARYARNVVARETERSPRPRKAALFAPQHPDDEITQLCLDQLVRPMACRLGRQPAGWKLETFFHEAATKDRLGLLLGGPETPDLLFTASHGLLFSSGDPRQLNQQGALLCEGWRGPRAGHGQAIPKEAFFSGEDLENRSAQVDLRGLLCFHLACFSAGTPCVGSSNRFPMAMGKPLAPEDFVAELPRRLLAHPKGALAVIGHVDTVWECSLAWGDGASQVPVFASTLRLLMDGAPVGEAMRYFGERHGEIAADLVELLEAKTPGKGCDDKDLARLWLARQDARSYVVLGDPAVRLPVGNR